MSMTKIDSMRRVGCLVNLACWPKIGAITATGSVTDGHRPRGWFANPHLGVFPEPSGSCERHYSNTRTVVDHAPAAAAHSQLLINGCSASSPPALAEVAPSLSDQWPAPSPAVSGLLSPAAEAIPPLPGPSIAAATSLEDSLALALSPTQLGVQLWEGAHAATGLPWWAAIPTATFALRGALLPLSLRAYAASSNVAMLHQAFELSRAVAEAVAAAAKQQQPLEAQRGQVKPQEGPEVAADEEATGRVDNVEGGMQPTARSSGTSETGGTRSTSAGVTKLGRLDLVRRTFSHLRAEHRPPSFGWYVGNAIVQVSLLGSCSLALRRMSDSLWPGFTGEGLLYFKDLTAPPLYLQTLSTPFGTAGAILPLALVLVYVSAVDKSAGGSSPGIHMALKLLVLPLYCAALLQPHAVLLYWFAQAATQLGVYTLAASVPALRRAAGVPEMLMEAPARDAAAVPSAELLLSLSESYKASGNVAAARACLEALLARQPDHSVAADHLRLLGGHPGK